MLSVYSDSSYSWESSLMDEWNGHTTHTNRECKALHEVKEIVFERDSLCSSDEGYIWEQFLDVEEEYKDDKDYELGVSRVWSLVSGAFGLVLVAITSAGRFIFQTKKGLRQRLATNHNHHY